jgi:hypothetical protein
MRNIYKFFVEKPEEKRPIGKPRHSWNNIGKALTEMG